MDQAKNRLGKRSLGKRSLVFIGVTVVLLILSVVISFKARPFKSSFRVEEVLICQELDGSRQPLKVGSSIPYGARQVCLWFKYAFAREGDFLEVSWYYDKDMVLSERVGLVSRDGVRIFYLLKEEGVPLPQGNYRVVVSSAAKQLSEISFHIDKK